MVIDEWKMFTCSSPLPSLPALSALADIFVTRMLTRDLFVAANSFLFCIGSRLSKWPVLKTSFFIFKNLKIS